MGGLTSWGSISLSLVTILNVTWSCVGMCNRLRGSRADIRDLPLWAHAGVINVLTHARDCFPNKALHGVLGGFHLAGPNEPVIPDTVEAVRAFNLTTIAACPLHRMARCQRTIECIW
jgi:hypothetical protein